MERYCQAPNGMWLRSVRPPVMRLPSGKGSPEVAAIAVNVHVDIRRANGQHRAKVFDGPDGMHPVARAGTGDECWRNIGGVVNVDDAVDSPRHITVAPRHECRLPYLARLKGDIK